MRRSILAFGVFLQMALPAHALTLQPLPLAETAPLLVPVADGCGRGSYRDPALQECGTSFFRFHDPDRLEDWERYRREWLCRCQFLWWQ
jgi:hypothetical protein